MTPEQERAARETMRQWQQDTEQPDQAEDMRPFLVIIQQNQERDTHLYSLLSVDEQRAEHEALRQFQQEYTPDEPGDWTAVVLTPTFSRQPVHVARLDEGL